MRSHKSTCHRVRSVILDTNSYAPLAIVSVIDRIHSNRLELDTPQHGLEVKIVIKGANIVYFFASKDLYVNSDVIVLPY
jgi:hypothetical protein